MVSMALELGDLPAASEESAQRFFVIRGPPMLKLDLSIHLFVCFWLISSDFGQFCVFTTYPLSIYLFTL